MPICFDCGKPWDRDTKLHCACPPGGHRPAGAVGPVSGSPDESTCPVELRGLGWRQLPSGRWEPAWVAVAAGRDRIRGAAPQGCSHPEWYTGVEMVIDLSTLLAIARAEREERGIPYIGPEHEPRVLLAMADDDETPLIPIR